MVRIGYPVVQSPEIFLFVGEVASLRKDVYRKEMEAVTGRLATAKEVKQRRSSHRYVSPFLGLSECLIAYMQAGKMFSAIAKPR